MRHKHTLETDEKVKNRCIKKNQKTDECIDKNTLSVALKNLLFEFETKIKDKETNLDYIEDKFNILKNFVKNEKLGGDPGNPDNTILDDENTIKEIIEQFLYLTKTPDFITKIKNFLEKNNIFKTGSETGSETETETETETQQKIELAEQAVKSAKTEFELKEKELENFEKEKATNSEFGLQEEKEQKLEKLKLKQNQEEIVKKAEQELEKLKEAKNKIKNKAEKEKNLTNKSFEIKYIDNDMFVSDLDSDSNLYKLKKEYYFNIDYYKSQAQFEEFKTQLNQLNELKKNYQDLISKFESAIKEFKNKKTNLEKLINTYFKNSLLKKREILTKFDDFIKNITKNVNNIKDIPQELINYLTVKKISIQTSLIEKSFPDFKNPNKIDFEKLTISSEHDIDANKLINFPQDNTKSFNILSIIDDKDKTFNLEPRDRKIVGNMTKFTYKMTNSENKKYNHKLIISIIKNNNTKYRIQQIEAEIDRNIQHETRGGENQQTGDEGITQQERVNNAKPKGSTEIKGLNEVFLNLQKKNDFVIKQKIRDGVDVSGVNSKDIEKGDVGDDIIETLVLDYERKKQNVKTMDEKERIDREFLEKVNGLGLNLNEIFEVNLMDKFYFILYSLVLHIITYSIIESLIMSSNLNSLVSIMGIYSFLYVLLIILSLGIIHIYGYRGKVFLNYLNLDHNFYNIIGHFIIVAIFFGIILILSQYINTANIENEDERVKMLYRIEIITGVMFVFTTMFILIL